MKSMFLCALFTASLAVSMEFSILAQSPASQDAPAQTAQAPLQQAAPPAGVQQSGPPGAGGQSVANPNGVYTIQRNARLVILDVVVKDAKGNLVTDLKREDFNVVEAKQPQTLLNFETSGAHAVDPQVTINSTADLDRLAPKAPVNIILLDEFNTRFEDMAFARYSLKKFLSTQPDKLAIPTMLLAVSLEQFTVLNDYTQNKQAILDSLDHHFVQYPWQARQISWRPEIFGTAFTSLMRVAEATEGHPGHKNMIWIGRVFRRSTPGIFRLMQKIV
jgi:VWFA-related protein